MIDAPLAFAFTVGMVAAVNPCGFAMLPAYLSFFLGRSDGGDDDPVHSIGRAVVTTLSLSAGFTSVFLAVGSLLGAGVDGLRDVLPWVVIVIGVAMVVLGLGMTTGRDVAVRIPRLQRGAGDRGVASMVLFGASYATASLGCTLPLFLVAVVNRPVGVTSALVSMLAYSLGMTLTIGALTLSLALARSTVLSGLRRVVARIERISGALLVLTGTYTVWFWVNELTPGSGQPAAIRWVERRSFEIQRWVERTGGVRVGLLLAMVVAGVVLAALISAERAARRRPARRTPDERPAMPDERPATLEGSPAAP